MARMGLPMAAWFRMMGTMAYVRKHDRNRPRSWWSLFIRLGGWGSLILGVFLVIFTLLSWGQLVIADRLDADGRHTLAAVIDKRMVEVTDSDGDTDRSYYVTFRFKTALGGRDVERDADSSYFNEVTVGDKVPVRYLLDDPDVVEYDVGQYRRGGVFVRWLGLFIGLGGLYTLWRFGSQTNAAILARRDGEKRFADVIGITELNVEINGRRQGRLMWREPDGQTGESLMHSVTKLSNLYKSGDKIVVFRLGDDAFWEGDVGPPKREVDGI